MESISTAITGATAALDWEAVTGKYRAQGEFLALESLLPAPVTAALVAEAERLRPAIHRTYLPGYKKGGSVGYNELRASAPSTLEAYYALASFVSRLVAADVQVCPDDDPHACAMYFYTEPGDHIGFHYDTSHYAGARFTMLVGLINRSHSTLECHLHTKNRGRERVELGIATDPGTVVVFNGDTVWHRVTPIAAGEERVSLSFEYVTSRDMSRLRRAVSNVKDAIAYFGFSAVFRRRRR